MRQGYRSERVSWGKPHVSAVTIVAAIALVAMLAGLTVAWWHGRQHLFSTLFVAAALTLAAAMTIERLPPAIPSGGSTPAALDSADSGAP